MVVQRYLSGEGSAKSLGIEYSISHKTIEAIAKEKDVNGIILHSDQGFQYTSFEYKAICAAKGITISMSRKGTPIDDSPMESFHGILKKETLYNNYITSLEEYTALVEDWIEFYNAKISIIKKYMH